MSPPRCPSSGDLGLTPSQQPHLTRPRDGGATLFITSRPVLRSRENTGGRESVRPAPSEPAGHGGGGDGRVSTPGRTPPARDRRQDAKAAVRQRDWRPTSLGRIQDADAGGRWRWPPRRWPSRTCSNFVAESRGCVRSSMSARSSLITFRAYGRQSSSSKSACLGHERRFPTHRFARPAQS